MPTRSPARTQAQYWGDYPAPEHLMDAYAEDVRRQCTPLWEAVYEPGNVSDYLIGYTNDEAPAKAAGEAWFRSQHLDPVGELVWHEQVTGAGHLAWFDLAHIALDGDETATGITVRCRIAVPPTPPSRERSCRLTQEHPAHSYMVGRATRRCPGVSVPVEQP